MSRTDVSAIDAPCAKPGPEAPGSRFGLDAKFWGAALAITIGAIVAQAVGHLNGDDSWFLTFAEKFVDGQVPYVDISDPNPPAAFLVYVPAVLLARLIGLRPEFALVVLTFLGALAAIFVSGWIARKARLLRPAEVAPACLLALYVCLLVPAFCFAEREHIAFIALQPITVVLAARATGRPVTLLAACLAGLSAGLAAAFKPYFVLPIFLAVTYVLARRPRPLLRLLPELCAAGAVLVAYAAAIRLFFPAYMDMLAIAMEVYAPVRDTLGHLVPSPLFLANVALLGAYFCVARLGRPDPRAGIAAVFSAGFLATFLIQGKGWNNHALPGVCFALLALAARVGAFAPDRAASDPANRICRWVRLYLLLPALCGAPFLFGAAQLLGNVEEHPGLTEAVARIAPPRPKIAALAEQLDFGHPLVRHLDGTWVGRQNCLWISWGVKYLRREAQADAATEARRTHLLEEDVKLLADDIRRNRPDIVLIEGSELESWARVQPALSSFFGAYVQAARVGSIEIWRPKSG